MRKELTEAEAWLAKAVRNAPHPLPQGRFPQILKEAEKAGFNRADLLDVLDIWLNAGWCQVVDEIMQEIALTPKGIKNLV